MKKYFTFVLLWMVSMVYLPTAALAEHEGHGGKQCPMSEKDCDHQDCKGGDDTKCPIVGKLMKKAGFFLENQKEIGLSEDQVTQIKAIKMEAKRGYIRAGADMEIFELDLKEKLSDPVLDTDSVNAMIDQASAGMASGAKASIASYVKLKAVLSPEQMAKAKEIWISK